MPAVSQDEQLIFRRSRHWQPEVLEKLAQPLRLESLKFTLPLEPIYEGVELFPGR